jgi:hypothetical protein
LLLLELLLLELLLLELLLLEAQEEADHQARRPAPGSSIGPAP